MQECSTKSRSYLCADDSPISISVMSIPDLISLTSAQLSGSNKTSLYAICIFLEDGGKHTVDFETFHVKEKHILFLTQDQINQFHLPANYKGKLLVFSENFLCQNDVQTQFFGQSSLFSDLFKSPYFSLGDRFEEIFSLFNFISEELSRPYNEVQVSILNNYLFNILLITERLYKPHEQDISLVIDSSKLLVSQFKSVVNEDLNKQYNLEYYAKKLNVGLRTLQNAFIEVEKQSPKQWLTDRMIIEIKRNLAYNDFRISEIAYNLGFKEVTNFTKFFKSKTNLTPSMFRESLLA
ncbi:MULTISPECIES: helix-turn-helix domain-containing protein [Elizabethkingia]|nr:MULTISPECIES: helix-turn-helix domain-containing protein [Elizabethkingia]MDX8576934.1 helix-turn-helix domain-containing protein [Elizabethkingia sp. HX WYD]